MVWCNHCGKQVPASRPFDAGLCCDLCGRILEDANYSTEVTFVKNAAGQSQACGNVVNSSQSGISFSRERRLRIARDEFTNLRDALGIGDDRADVINMSVKFFTMAVELRFTRGRRTELVQASCLYLSCRELKIPSLLIDFSSYLRVSVYELGSVYLELCHKLYLEDRWNYERLVDPSIFIPRFTNSLLKGRHDKAAVVTTAKHIITSMKRDWLQTGRKPSGICGAALYTAALSHGIKCSKTDIVNIVHICEATLTKRLIEFGNTEAGGLTVYELTEHEKDMYKRPLTTQPDSISESVHCKHQKCEPFGYGLCKECYDNFMEVSGGINEGSNPPAFQQAVKENVEKEAREKNEGGVSSDEQCSERAEGKIDEDDENAEASDESGNFADINDAEVDGYINNEEEKRYKKVIWEQMHREYLEEQAAKEAALKEAMKASNSDCPEHLRKLFEANKAAVTKSRKEKQQKRAEEAKNAPPPATAMDAVRGMCEKKRFSSYIDFSVLDELLDISTAEKSPKRSKTEPEMEKKKEEKKEMRSNEDENGENEEDEAEEDEEDSIESYGMKTDEKFYEEEDGYDF